jgi:hypothetical protein
MINQIVEYPGFDGGAVRYAVLIRTDVISQDAATL